MTPFNIVDLAILAVFILVLVYYLRKGFFVGLFTTLRLVIAYIASLILALPIALIVGQVIKGHQSLVGLVAQIGCFVLIWLVSGIFRPTFDQTIMAKVGSWPLFYHGYKIAVVIPAVITAFIMSMTGFTLLVNTPVVSSPHLLAGQSWWGKMVASRVYAASISVAKGTSVTAYQSLAYRVGPKPAVISQNSTVANDYSVPVQSDQYQGAIDQARRINNARNQVGLHPVSPPPIAVVPNQQPIQVVPTQAPFFSFPTTQPQPQATTLPNPNAIPQPINQPLPAPINVSNLEQQVVELTNAERAKQGVGPLSSDANIAAVARAHSQDMVNRGFFDHVNPDGLDPFQRLRLGGVSFTAAAENIASFPTVESAIVGWMNSAGHRANILNSTFGRVGVGIAIGQNGNLTFTQDFAN